MTGPAPGKVPLEARIELCSRDGCVPVAGRVYLHVKGWSLARVTHVDVESPVLNELFPPGWRGYRLLLVRGGALRVKLGEPRYVEGLGVVARELRIESGELAGALGEGCRTWVFLGGKEGGVFLGFRRECIARLEGLAAEKDVRPRGRI